MKRFGFFTVLGLVLLAIALAACASSPSASRGGPSGSGNATAQGFGGPVTVTVTMEKGKITDVKAEGLGETPGIGSRAIEMLPALMIEKNSVAVDGISGASITSRALLDAAKEAASRIQG